MLLKPYILTQTILWTANVDAINNFTRKMEELKRQRDDLKVTYIIATGFLSELTIVVDLLCNNIS